ncbi:MAG: hypothetical protein ACRYFX_26445 [Janthinobacterium lividum]
MLLRYSRQFAFSLLALAASACAPTYMLGVKPAQPNTFFASAQPQAEASAENVSLRLNFLGYEPNWVVLNAEYRNDSAQPVSIDPAAFSYAPLRETATAPAGVRVQRGELVPAVTAAASLRAPWPALPTAPLGAFSPEAHIGELEAGADREAAKARRTDWVGIALFAVVVGSQIASIGHGFDTPVQADNAAAIYNIAWAYSEISMANKMHHAATAAAMAQQARHLSEYALRPVLLQPGQQVRGYVYLPRFDDADGLRVYAPIGHQRAALDFVQTHQRR